MSSSSLNTDTETRMRDGASVTAILASRSPAFGPLSAHFLVSGGLVWRGLISLVGHRDQPCDSRLPACEPLVVGELVVGVVSRRSELDNRVGAGVDARHRLLRSLRHDLGRASNADPHAESRHPVTDRRVVPAVVVKLDVEPCSSVGPVRRLRVEDLVDHVGAVRPSRSSVASVMPARRPDEASPVVVSTSRRPDVSPRSQSNQSGHSERRRPPRRCRRSQGILAGRFIWCGCFVLAVRFCATCWSGRFVGITPSILVHSSRCSTPSSARFLVSSSTGSDRTRCP